MLINNYITRMMQDGEIYRRYIPNIEINTSVRYPEEIKVFKFY